MLRVGLINPEREYIKTPDDYSISNYKDHTIVTGDGFKIATWEFNPTKKLNSNKPLLIISCGDAGNMSYTLLYVKKLIEMGYTIFTYDYRGFGKSDDFKISKKYLYANEYKNDLIAVVEFARKQYPFKHVGLFGFSMGTVVSTQVVSNTDVKIDFMIAENFVLNPLVVKERLLKEFNKEVLLPNDAEHHQQLAMEINCPVMMISSEKDLVTTLEDSNKMKKINSKNRIISHQKGHGQGILGLSQARTGDLYFELIDDFIESLN